MNNKRAYPTLVMAVSLLGMVFLIVQHQLDIPSAESISAALIHPAIGTNLPAVRYAGSYGDAAKLQATLTWSISTNWSAGYVTRTLMGWSGGTDPNFNTYHETGTIVSNLVAYLEWKGQRHGVILESVELGRTNRSYRVSEERIYIEQHIYK